MKPGFKPALPPTSWESVLASWFGIGYLPKAPGTWGSIATLPLAFVIITVSGLDQQRNALLISSAIVFCVGWLASARLIRRGGVQDPQWIVIDEVAGQLATLAFAGTYPLLWAVAFISFRVADVLKPFPASWADRRVPGGLGVMLDDMLAAIYSVAITWTIGSWLGEGS